MIKKQPYTYTMPEAFLADQMVPARWRVLAVINGFFLNSQKCWASNEWIGQKIGAHSVTVSRAVKELEELKIVVCERTRRSRFIAPVMSEISIGVNLRVTPTTISDTHQRLSNSDSNSEREKGVLKNKTRSSEESDVSITATDEDGNEIKQTKKGKGRLVAADRVAGYYNKKAQEYTGKPVLGFAYSIVKKLMEEKKLTEEFLKEVVDDFFESMPPDDKAVNPYICFSLQSVNRKLLS